MSAPYVGSSADEPTKSLKHQKVVPVFTRGAGIVPSVVMNRTCTAKAFTKTKMFHNKSIPGMSF